MLDRWTIVGSVVGLIATLGSASADEVRVYNWSFYIDEELLQKFEDETGIDIIYDEYDTEEEFEETLLIGNAAYDLVLTSSEFLQDQISVEAYQKLDRQLLPNAVHLWDFILNESQSFDPDNAYSVNYMWGTTGIAVDYPQVSDILGENAPVDSLALIFDPSYLADLSECGVVLIDSPTEIVRAALLYIGEDPDSQDLEVIAKAETVLAGIAPYVEFESEGIDDMIAEGDACAVFGWSGDLLAARDYAYELENGVEIEYYIPSEGALIWFDQWAIPADAKNVKAAHRFLNFMMDPENVAAASNYVYYANGNFASKDLLLDEVLEDPAIYPSDDVLATLYSASLYNIETRRFIDRMWNRALDTD